MNNNNIIPLKQPEENSIDGLTELLRNGAKELISQAVNAELEELLAHHSEKKIDGKQAVIRNGYLPKRTVQTGLGDVDVQVPKVRDKSHQGIKFNSLLIPPYLKRTESIEELLPVLYFKRHFNWRFFRSLEIPARRKCKRLVSRNNKSIKTTMARRT